MVVNKGTIWWPEPAAGDIVWCRFPMPLGVELKPRPILIVTVFEDHAPQFEVAAAFGTSQRTDKLFAGEFLIRQALHPHAYALARLSLDTKFNMCRIAVLPYSDEWFDIAPGAPLGHDPKLGTLHSSMLRTVAAAASACP